MDEEVRRHIKVFDDPDDEAISQVRCPPLKIPAESTVGKTDFFSKFGLGDLPVFDKVLDTLPGIAGKVSVGHGGLFSGQGLLISEILIPEDNVQHLPRGHDERSVWEMPDISGHKISIFLFSFFNNHFIKYEIFGIRQFYVKMLDIDIKGTFMKSAHNGFYEIFGKMKLWTGKYFPIFLFYHLIQNGYGWPVKGKFYDATRNRVCFQNC
jgi:hypothetical protein